MMFSSTEAMVAWAGDVLGLDARTYLPRGASGSVDSADARQCVVERTGGDLDYPHDSPQFSMQCWARRESDAEQMANVLAIACRTRPPADAHVNAVGVPSVLSYGREDGGWFVWQTNVALEVSLLD